MTDAFTHETTCRISDYDRLLAKEHIGDIDVRITYVVDSWGAPARIRYNENDHPAEPPEINVVHVEMLNAPKSGHEAVWIDAWDWLCEWAYDWCNENAYELAGKAKLEIQDARDADDDRRWRDRRMG